MFAESSPLLAKSKPQSRWFMSNCVSLILRKTWIVVMVIGFLFLQQIVNGTLSASNENGGLIVGLDQDFNPVGNHTGCYGIWSCTFETCEIYSQPDALYAALRLPGECALSVSMASTWDVYSDWIIFRLSRIAIYLALVFQVVSVFVYGILLFAPHSWARWGYLAISLLTFGTIEIAYVLWMVFINMYRHLSGDIPPSYLNSWVAAANVFIMVTVPLVYDITLI